MLHFFFFYFIKPFLSLVSLKCDMVLYSKSINKLVKFRLIYGVKDCAPECILSKICYNKTYEECKLLYESMDLVNDPGLFNQDYFPCKSYDMSLILSSYVRYNL